MSTHGYWLMGIATFAFAAGLGSATNDSPARSSEALLAAKQALVAEIAASARDSLQRATPEIALPALQIYAPAPVVMER
jgi:hypothetical protein